MAREVNKEQPFQDKIVKLIPTEIVGAYLVILGIIGPTDEVNKVNEYSLTAAFFILLLFTPIYLWRVSGVTNGIQLAVSTASFAVWVYTLVYPFKFWSWHYSTVGAVILILWSLITPIFVTPAIIPAKNDKPEGNKLEGIEMEGVLPEIQP